MPFVKPKIFKMPRNGDHERWGCRSNYPYCASQSRTPKGAYVNWLVKMYTEWNHGSA